MTLRSDLAAIDFAFPTSWSDATIKAYVGAALLPETMTNYAELDEATKADLAVLGAALREAGVSATVAEPEPVDVRIVASTLPRLRRKVLRDRRGQIVGMEDEPAPVPGVPSHPASVTRK